MFYGIKTLVLSITLFIIFTSCISDKNPINNNAPQPLTLIVDDYEYVRNKYFFVDIDYHNNYNSGIERENPMIWNYSPQNKIVSLDLFISTSSPASDVIKGIASVDPAQFEGLQSTNYDSIEVLPGEIEKGFLKKLIEGEDYWVDYYRGFIGLENSISNNKFLSIAYVTNSDTIGTPLNQIVRDTTILFNTRLIKSINLSPDHNLVWPLMMKNIYHFEPPNEGDDLNISISTYNNGEDILYLPDNKKQSFLNLLGLDLLDSNGQYVELGDDKLDDNPQIIDLKRGTLIFPCLQPFSPNPSSHFKIPEDYYADIYNSLNIFDIYENKKFILKFITTKND